MIEKANKIFLENFKPEACFERAVFFSWYCGIADCKYCYMSTQKTTKKAVRSLASLLAETFLCKKLGWEFGFLSGGFKAYTTVKFKEILKNIVKVNGEKVWINIGALKKDEIEEFLPYIKGVVGSVETVNPKVHEYVCPSKPIEPVVKMFKDAKNLKKAMTIILGLGETIKDFELLKEFIEENDIVKIHFYSLNPQKGTVFEKAKPIKAEYQAEWIARTRIAFPKIDIQAGIWIDKVKNVSLLLKAGANSISKFPAIRYFNTAQAKEIELQAKKAGRKFNGTLTKLPKINLDEIDFDSELTEEIKEKLGKYLKIMER